MKKINNKPIFPTDICEDAVSKRTLISAITGLKRFLSEPIYTVTPDKVTDSYFSEIINFEGCLHLRGYSASGFSLYELYNEYKASSFFSESTRNFLYTILDIINASTRLQSYTGYFPPIFLNATYIDKEKKHITILPSKMVEFLSKYREVQEQRIMTYCIETSYKDFNIDEYLFTQSLGKLIYLFFSKNLEINRENIFDIRDFINDIPSVLSDTLWDLLHGKKLELQKFSNVIETALQGDKRDIYPSIPFKRKKNYLIFRYSLARFFVQHKKLIIVLLIIAGIASYLLFDFFTSKKEVDYTAGLDAEQVVELYFYGIENLDIDIIDAVFYRRAGKEIKNEVNTLFVMNRLDQAFGKKLVGPEELEEQNTKEKIDNDYQSIKVYGIKQLEIKKLKNDENPVFNANYEKYLGVGDDITVYSIEETIYLSQYDDHWYIIRADRIITEAPES